MDFIKNLQLGPANLGHFNLNQIINSPVGNIIILFVVILFASFSIDYLLSHSLLGQRYRIFVAPGVIVHELSHAVFCVLTGAKITKISLFDKTGGYVEHRPSKIPILGQFLISFSPFAFGLLIIYFLILRLGLSNANFSLLPFSPTELLVQTFAAVRQIGFFNSQNLVFLYLITSICVTMTPSWQDLANALISVVVLSIIGIGSFLFLHYKLTLLATLLNPISVMLTTVLFLLILLLVLSIIIYMISFIFNR